jgi:arylsulfatase A-like enzyme
VQRLWPALGETAFVRLEDETRPALRLRLGEGRSCPVSLERGSRLYFAVGLAESAPSSGYLRLQVLANGREVFHGRFPLARHAHWWRRSMVLDVEGPTTLEFRGELLRGPEAEPLTTDEASAPWILLASPRVYPPRDTRPKRILVWISQDTVRADHLSAYGYARPTSPELERLSREWTVFENGVASASWTLPSLAAQITSRHPSYHGAVLHAFGTRAADTTLFEALAAHGFTVLGVTGNTFVSSGYGLARGFDALSYTEGHAEEIGQLALRALEEWGGGDLALFVHYMDAHAPYAPPAPFERRFTGSYDGDVNGRNFDALDPLTASAEDIGHVVGLYDAEITYTDQEIGRLLDDLGRRGLLEGAVLGYTADHGEEFLEHGSWHHGGTLYEEVLRVPFAVRLPGEVPRRVKEPVSLVDFAPTVLDALGVDRPGSFQGRSLVPVLKGGSLPGEPLYSETELTADRTHVVAVREGSLKYVLHVTRGRENEARVLRDELFDLSRDPRERASRAGSPEAERLRRFALAYLVRARREAAALSPVSLDPQTLERLKALGYVR